MNCPHCQKELPVNYDAAWCPFCGRDLTLPKADSPQETLPPFKIKWWLFLAAMFAPLLLTILAVLLGAKRDNVSPMIALIGGGIAGIVCGVMLGLQGGDTTTSRVFISILMALVMAVVCIGLSCFGCMTAGFQLHFG
jgi:lipopolysaccharide export LptBFGC system permease protein LptF